MAKHPGLIQEPMLNGLPLREVQAREKRGQIIDYPGQSWLGETRGEMTGVRLGKDVLPPMAGKTSTNMMVPDKRIPRTPVLELDGGMRMPKQGSPWGQPVPDMGNHSLARLWFRYRAAIDGWLAKTPWMSGASFNFLPLVLILGLGVFLPVKIIFGLVSLFFLPWPGLSNFVSVIGTTAGIGLILYFGVRKLSNTTAS
jgi:hypothetical protein